MFKKYYFVHLVERNITVVNGNSSYQEWTGIIQAKDPMTAAALAKKHAAAQTSAPKSGYLLRDIKRI